MTETNLLAPRRLLTFCLVSLLAVPFTCAFAAPVDEDESIRRHRMGTLVVRTEPGADVEVEQIRHEFWFGTAIANQAFDGKMSEPDRARYLAAILENFNSAVTENALKWMAMEPRRGDVNYRVVDAMLAWAEEHRLPLRGHNIYWGVPQWTMSWQKELDDTALRKTVEQRGRDIGRRYRGRFVEYDLNNEMIHGNFYAERLGPRITLDMANWVKAEDPDAKLFLNDYDILTGRRLKDYVHHIRELIDMGVPVAGIGVQGHLHGDDFDPAALRNALDELAQFHLPIRVTEFNFPGQRSKFYKDRALEITPAEEEAKAKAIAEYYRICFGHPAVEGILMWGFWEGANWIPQSSLYKRDWTPTPALHAYRDLVFNTWWTRWRGKADEHGRCVVPAFYGAHRVRAGSREATVDLKKQNGFATADLRSGSEVDAAP